MVNTCRDHFVPVLIYQSAKENPEFQEKELGKAAPPHRAGSATSNAPDKHWGFLSCVLSAPPPSPLYSILLPFSKVYSPRYLLAVSGKPFLCHDGASPVSRDNPHLVLKLKF